MAVTYYTKRLIVLYQLITDYISNPRMSEKSNENRAAIVILLYLDPQSTRTFLCFLATRRAPTVAREETTTAPPGTRKGAT